MAPRATIAPLFDGALDLVGDVHGEREALGRLLGHLGYDRHGGHPAGRRLVFVGDLCDRGPDSPGVIAQVRDLVARGHAQCVLGNHELNILRRNPIHGNEWFPMRQRTERPPPEFAACRAATTEEEREEILAFFGRLPLALERPDLRVVHASWDPAAIAATRAATDDAVTLFHAHERALDADPRAAEVKADKEAFKRIRWVRGDAPPASLPALARWQSLRQNENPVRGLTMGREEPVETPRWSGGSWRLCARERWWLRYAEEPAVVVGHYWRTLGNAPDDDENEDLFEGVDPLAWLGARRRVFCVDYSVGRRYRERQRGQAALHTRLAALRWPERELVTDHGERLETRA